MDFLESFKKNRAFDLPTLPKVTLKVISSLNDENFSMSELSETISLDPTLATQMISMANSSFYSSMAGCKVDSVHRAVVELGADTIRNFALILSLRGSFKSAARNGFDLSGFWRRSITAAVAAQALARIMQIRSDDIFIVALLMDIGELVMQACEPKLYHKTLDMQKRTKCHLKTAERNFFRTDHQEVGGVVMKTWSLPESIYKPIRYHHSINECPEEYVGTVKVLVFCNQVSLLDFERSCDESVETLASISSNQFHLDSVESNSLIDDILEERKKILALFGGG